MEDVPSSNALARPVLVADDDEDVRDTLAAMLRHLGHDVEVASDGVAALEAVLGATVAPRLLLLDIGMPGLDGWEVASRLVDLPLRPRVVLITGSTLDRGRVRDGLGIDDVLLKPWTFEDLRRVLDA